MPVKYSVVDLFCGIGGLTQGFRKEKFKVTAGIDIDGTCKYAYEANNKVDFHEEDLSLLSSDFINNLFLDDTTRILVGCAPCQAFSTYSQKYKDNEKWKMLYVFKRIIEDIEPEIISMENVPNLKNYAGGKVFQDFLETLHDKNYSVSWKVVNCKDYGIPQNRKRLILFASKFGEVKFKRPSHLNNPVTVREAIGNLPKIADGEVYDGDELHRARKLSVLNKKRIQATPSGGGWKDWPEELLLECHKKESGKTFSSVYGRMRWDDVAPTMTTQCTGLGNGRFGHPEQDRAITIREASILQSFPKDYVLYDPEQPLSLSNIEMHIGNAVPVDLGRMVAKSIRNHLKEYNV